jgi:hypothetical protein
MEAHRLGHDEVNRWLLVHFGALVLLHCAERCVIGRRLSSWSISFLTTIAVGISMAQLLGQDQTVQETREFDVASVKPNRDTTAPSTFELSPAGRVLVTAYPLSELIRIAYTSNSIETEQQIVGGPNWLRSDRFDFLAKANGSLEADETGRPTRLLTMLRALLEDRFHLRVHTELREAPVYLLVLASKADPDRSFINRRRTVGARLATSFRQIRLAGGAAELAITQYRA